MKIASDACAVDTAFLPSRRRASKSGNSKSTFHCSASQISSLPLMPASSWVSLRTAAATSAPSDIGAAIVITCDARKTATVGPRGLGAIDGPPLGLPRLSRKLRDGRQRREGRERGGRERRAYGGGIRSLTRGEGARNGKGLPLACAMPLNSNAWMDACACISEEAGQLWVQSWRMRASTRQKEHGRRVESDRIWHYHNTNAPRHRALSSPPTPHHGPFCVPYLPAGLVPCLDAGASESLPFFILALSTCVARPREAEVASDRCTRASYADARARAVRGPPTLRPLCVFFRTLKPDVRLLCLLVPPLVQPKLRLAFASTITPTRLPEPRPPTCDACPMPLLSAVPLFVSPPPQKKKASASVWTSLGAHERGVRIDSP